MVNQVHFPLKTRELQDFGASLQSVSIFWQAPWEDGEQNLALISWRPCPVVTSCLSAYLANCFDTSGILWKKKKKRQQVRVMYRTSLFTQVAKPDEMSALQVYSVLAWILPKQSLTWHGNMTVSSLFWRWFQEAAVVGQWGSESGNGKKILKGVCATRVQSCWHLLGESEEHASELSQLRDVSASTPIHHWLGAASPEILTFPAVWFCLVHGLSLFQHSENIFRLRVAGVYSKKPSELRRWWVARRYGQDSDKSLLHTDTLSFLPGDIFTIFQEAAAISKRFTSNVFSLLTLFST